LFSLKKSFNIGGIAILVLLWSCSTKKDAFVNRNWHALNTKYNVLYNGKLALEEGTTTLQRTYRDNYWEILPVERLDIKEEIVLPGTETNPNFERAEEKATKAIQKHSMNLKNRERNPQTDEAFLLLGKARYYDQRFVPALEAFNYILYKYPNSDKIGDAKVWREKTNLRLFNEELALKNLKRLLRQEKLRDQTYADATAIMAQAYINLKQLDSAVKKLRVAAAYTRKNEEKGRYHYIVGQLYNELGHKDSANMAFDKVIALNRKSPRRYMINAHMEKAKNFDPAVEDKELLLELLTDLAENRENRPFLDRIYRQLAMFHLHQDSIHLAVDYFNRSLRVNSPDRYLNALNYENLAAINFEDTQYKIAGAYYDSTLTNLEENTRKYRFIFKKRTNLEDVIKYETIAQANDSIIHVAELSDEERTAYFEKYIADLKAKKEAEEKEAEKQNADTGIASGLNTQGNATKSDRFYFYNINVVGYGKNDFRQKWGQRPLEDNWRLSDKTVIEEDNRLTPEGLTDASSEDLYKVATYLDKLPDETQLDSIRKERDFAYYQLGLIYKEKLKEYTLAAGRLETLLKNDPEEKLVLPAKYNLYKIYQITGNDTGAFSVKQEIIAGHPDSRYAEILQNPEAVLSEDKDSPDARYTALYKQYQAQNYEDVIALAEQYVRTYNGEPIAVKFELLKANATGRLYGLKDYTNALNYIALNHPNDPTGKEAARILKESVKQMENKVFIHDSISNEKWKLIFPFKRKDTAEISKLYKKVEKAISGLPGRKLYLSKDVYDTEQMFVVVHGLLTRDRALGLEELLRINKDYLIDHENFVLLTSNYKIIQIHKNLADYLKKENPLNPIN